MGVVYCMKFYAHASNKRRRHNVFWSSPIIIPSVVRPYYAYFSHARYLCTWFQWNCHKYSSCEALLWRVSRSEVKDLV